MKKAVEIKYPHSANLFQFCRRVLDHKFGGIRVIDQDVGSILGFDPADCSHWKKGKKNIRSIQAMKSIAEHLGVDERLVVDVASGDLDDSEAFFEFTGYGSFNIDAKVFESAKKDYYRRNAANWSKDKEGEFRKYFDINESAIEDIVSAIHAKINFQEAPLYLPEVVTAYPEIELNPVDGGSDSNRQVVSELTGKAQIISYTAGSEMRPYVRYRIAKAMADFFLNEKLNPTGITAGETNEFTTHLRDVQSNLFAAKLLAPANLIKKEMARINVSKDVVSQLAETFWVSKTFMNRRLKELLQGSFED
jgi:hypothetical protein